MGVTKPTTNKTKLSPEILEYYNQILEKHELTRSDVSIYPSYTNLKLPYRVICRQRYAKAGTKQRLQFLREIKAQEAIQSRALDGVRLHREFCNPIITPPYPEEIVKNGHIRRVVDDEVKSLVLELSGTNVATTYITCPIKARASLGIKLPFLVMVVKNMKKYFTFEIQIADDKDMRRRFRVSNFQSTTKVRPFCTTMPIGLSPGWNQIQFNLADFTKRAYGSSYLETVRVQVHANVRIRRIYFSDRLYGDDEMPQEFKLFLPIPGTTRRIDPNKEKRPSQEEQRGEEEEEMGAPPATPVEEEGLEEGAEEEGEGEAVLSEATEPVTAAAGGEEHVTAEEGAVESAPLEEGAEAIPAETVAGEEPPAEAPAEEPPAEEAPPPPAEDAPPAEEPPAEEPPAEEAAAAD